MDEGSFPIGLSIKFYCILHTNELITHYINSKTITFLNHYIQQDISNNPLYIKGLTGSIDALLIAALQQKSHRLQLVILEDYATAWAIYGDLQNLLPAHLVYFFPSVDYSASPEQIKFWQNKRKEIIYTIMQDKTIAVIVTPMEALIEKIEVPCNQNSYTIALGQSLALSTFIQFMQDKNITQVDTVYEKGQFAVRGGIVDVYSMAQAWPYRIEWGGNTISSIRLFNPKDQKSFKTLSKAIIASHIQALPKEKEAYASFTTFLKKDSVIWLKNKQQALEKLSPCQANSIESTQPPNESKQSLLACLALFCQIEFGKTLALEKTLCLECFAEKQPEFRQNFHTLSNDLYTKNQQGYKTFITSVSSGQFSRLHTLFEQSANPPTFTPLLLGLRQGYIDHVNKVVCYTDHQIFNKYYRVQQPKSYKPTEVLLTQALKDLHVGDYVVHSDYGIGRFSGLQTLHFSQNKQEAIRLVYKNNDVVFVSVNELYKITKYSSKDDAKPTMHKLGTAVWKNRKQTVKKQIKDIAKELIALYAERRKNIGFAFSKDNALEIALASSFCYEETPDQALAIAAVKADMERNYPMDRLICGDVGFGKTEIAIRAAFKATLDQKQVAVLVPTTILAMQHYNSFTQRLADFPVNISYLNRFKTKQEIHQTLLDTASGKIDILIGTHKLLSQTVKFKDLGLLIIDEEQKFGVKAKEQLKQWRCHIDSLTLSATPIPRTLHFSLMGARDLSILNTPPVNRYPVKTTVQPFDLSIIQKAIQNELARGGQVFFVHNKISTIDQIAQTLIDLLPMARICVAHGQMHGTMLEDKILNFIAGKYDVLISTSIVESGLDIANANTMLINNSHLLGLADLHQMRGRVGRSNVQAFCYLLTPNNGSMTRQAQLRLKALEEFSELGDGFNIAMRDLDIRGTGDLLGAAQSGFIADVGFETYCKLLQEAVHEVKLNDFKELFPEQMHKNKAYCAIETDCDAHIPSDYISNSTQRLTLYTRINALETLDQLTEFKQELLDRFGPLPMAVKNLLAVVQLRWQAQSIGIYKLIFKNHTLHCYLDNTFQQQYPKVWDNVLKYVQKNPKNCKLKATSDHLIVSILESVNHITAANQLLKQIAPYSQEPSK